MDKTSWMALSIIGTLLSTAGLADDAKSSSPDPEPLPMVILTVETLLAESEYTFRWQLFHPAEAIANSNWPQPIADFHFQDASALARVSKLRSLSLLTLAESGQVRLYHGGQ